MIFVRIIFRIFYCFMFWCLLFLAMLLLLCIFVNILQVSYFYFASFVASFNDCNTSSCSTFFHFHINIDKDADKVIFKRLVTKFKTFCIFNCLFAAFLQKQIKTPDYYEVIRNKFFTFDYIDTCEDIQILITWLTN